MIRRPFTDPHLPIFELIILEGPKRSFLLQPLALFYAFFSSVSRGRWQLKGRFLETVAGCCKCLILATDERCFEKPFFQRVSVDLLEKSGGYLRGLS